MSGGRLYSYEMYGSDSWNRTFGKLDWGGSKDYYGNPIKADTEKFLRGVLTLLADKRNYNKYFACDCNALLYSALCDEEFGYSLTEEAKTGLILSLIACGANVKDDHIFSDAARAVHGGLWLNDIKRGYSSTPSRCNMPVIKCMIAAGADVNDYHKSYSYYAEGYGEAYCDACPLIDDIILHRRGDDEAVNLLIECGADMDKEYWYSVYDDENDEKRKFREKQTELRRNYLNGNSPHREEMSKAEQFLWYLKRNIETGRIDKALVRLHFFTTSNILLDQWEHIAKSDKEMMQKLYELKNKFKSFDLDLEDSYGGTLLSTAIYHNYMETAKTLFSLGADVKKKEVLRSAVFSGNIEITEKLINLGADINKCKALNAAVNSGYIEMVEKLIDFGADVNGKAGDDNWTPLHEAVCWLGKNNVPMVRMLIERGADVNIQNKFGQTPLDMLMDPRNEIKHREEMKELIRNAAKIRADYLARQTQPTIVAKRNHENTDSGRQYS
ncbi:MAG: ankyrin repeat domain-containing protein [Alphaproteobacteria bacterium]|nr:ankyrin repeat domain-containing protein [Alphaproteobacteria bacterium]